MQMKNYKAAFCASGKKIVKNGLLKYLRSSTDFYERSIAEALTRLGCGA